MNKLAKKLTDKSGATLLIVITIFAIVVIVGSLLITIGSASYKNSISFHNQKQAYYTARSVLNTVVKGMSDANTWQGASGTGGIKAALDSATVNAEGHRVLTASGSNLDGMGEYDVEIKQTSATGSRVAIKVTVTANYKGKGYKLSATLKEQSSDMEPIRFTFFARQGSVTVAPSNGNAVIEGDMFGRGSLSLTKSLVNVNDVQKAKAIITNGSVKTVNSQLNGNMIVQISSGNIDIDTTSTMLGKIYTDCDYSKFTGTPMSSFDVEQVDTDKIGMKDAIQSNIRTIDKSFVVSNSVGEYHFANGIVANPTIGWVRLSNGVVLADDGGTLVAWKSKDEHDNNYGGSVDFTTIEDMDTSYGIKVPALNVDPATCTVELLNGDIIDLANRTYAIMSGGASPSVVGTIDLNTNTYEGVQLDDIILDNNGNYHMVATIGAIGGLPSHPGGSIVITDKLCTINSSSITGTYTFDTGAYQEGVDGDIRVIFDLPSSTTVDFSQAKIKIQGDNNVYFYFPDTVSRINFNNSNIGTNSSDDAQLYMINSAMGLTCKMDDSSRFKGVLYFSGDNSSFTLEGSSATTDDRIIGSVTADRIDINAGGNYRFTDLHKEPYFNTRLDTAEYFIYSRKNSMGWIVNYGD